MPYCPRKQRTRRGWHLFHATDNFPDFPLFRILNHMCPSTTMHVSASRMWLCSCLSTIAEHSHAREHVVDPVACATDNFPDFVLPHDGDVAMQTELFERDQESREEDDHSQLQQRAEHCEGQELAGSHVIGLPQVTEVLVDTSKGRRSNCSATWRRSGYFSSGQDGGQSTQPP